MPRISVILVNWNGLELTSKALRSLHEHADGVELEVIVVDNGSRRDDSRAELPRRFPGAKLLTNDDNEGFSRACNRAARVASGQYLLFLNNDTIQTEAALKKAADYLDVHPEVGVLGILHKNSSPAADWQPSAFRFPRVQHDVLTCLGLVRLMPSRQGYQEDASADVDWVCGSFFMVRRSAWQSVGEFDEQFFVYDEDIDWCLRARQKGVVVRYWPGASMVHLGAASGPSLRDKTFMHFRSRLTYYTKHERRLWSLAFYAAMSARLSVSSLAQLVKLALGMTDARSVAERTQRFLSFVLLRPARTGVRAS